MEKLMQMVEAGQMHWLAAALIPEIAAQNRPLVLSECGHQDITTTKIRGIGTLCSGCYADYKRDTK